MTGQSREEASASAREDEESPGALEQAVRAGLETEIAAARSALEEARGLLEGALRRTEEVFEEAPGVIPAVEVVREEP